MKYCAKEHQWDGFFANQEKVRDGKIFVVHEIKNPMKSP